MCVYVTLCVWEHAWPYLLCLNHPERLWTITHDKWDVRKQFFELKVLRVLVPQPGTQNKAGKRCVCLLINAQNKAGKRCVCLLINALKSCLSQWQQPCPGKEEASFEIDWARCMIEHICVSTHLLSKYAFLQLLELQFKCLGRSLCTNNRYAPAIYTLSLSLFTALKKKTFQLINQSINQSISQSINQSIYPRGWLATF